MTDMVLPHKRTSKCIQPGDALFYIEPLKNEITRCIVKRVGGNQKFMTHHVDLIGPDKKKWLLTAGIIDPELILDADIKELSNPINLKQWVKSIDIPPWENENYRDRYGKLLQKCVELSTKNKLLRSVKEKQDIEDDVGLN